MSNITLPIVIFDRQHLLFFLSRCHAINYLKQSPMNQLYICDGKGQVLSYEFEGNARRKVRQLESMDNVCICKGMLLEKFQYLLQDCGVSQQWLQELSVSQLISLAYDSF